MLTARERTIAALSNVVQETPIGTNISLLRVMWSMVTGAFLTSRGAIHGALAESGFEDAEIRRGWSGMRYGSWEIEELVKAWHLEIESTGEWEARKIEGYRAKGVDITGFLRPKLKGEVNKLYNSTAQRAVAAVIFGVVTVSGAIEEKRVPRIEEILRCKAGTSASDFHVELLKKVKKSLRADEVAIVDAGFTIAEMLESGILRFVLRAAINCTARRNELPEQKGRGRPQEYGEIVRPLSRTHNGKEIESTAADASGKFTHHGRTIEYQAWHNLVTSTTKVDKDNSTFSTYVFRDPYYDKPMVLTTVMNFKAESVYLFYKERWPVEHPPLATKQMMGLHRQFVFSDESSFRLPELGLLAGNILSHLAASLPPIPTGYWDRDPKSTPGRLRRALSREVFPSLDQLDPELRKKNSVFDHLPTGIDAHRRIKAVA